MEPSRTAWQRAANRVAHSFQYCGQKAWDWSKRSVASRGLLAAASFKSRSSFNSILRVSTLPSDEFNLLRRAARLCGSATEGKKSLRENRLSTCCRSRDFHLVHQPASASAEFEYIT